MAQCDNIIGKGADGFYHPTTEEQIIELVKCAGASGRKIRCRGAAHSLAWAIYTDKGEGNGRIPNKVSEQKPPGSDNLNVMLDQFAKLEWIDEANGIIEAETGIHLGYDPEDPTGTSTLENSFLYQTFLKGWTLSDLGGITHQTVGGFLSTGSAGGSLAYSLDENLIAFRAIDGSGNARWIERENEPDLFNAFGVSLGLLGVVTRVRFQLVRNFYIYGQEITRPTAPADCPIDLFGPGTAGKPSLQTFLEQTPYTRLLWWPQKGVERVVIWEAVRGAALPVFDPVPYTEFTDIPFATQIEQMFGAIMFTLLGNKGIWKPWKKLGNDYSQFNHNLRRKWTGVLGAIGAFLVTALMWIIGLIMVLIFGIFRGLLIWVFPKFVDILQPITKEGKGKIFMDYMWRSLPMDNAADDILLGTEFTEIWLPVSQTQRAMALLKEMFDRKGFAGTGYYMTELYAGHRSDYWMSPSYKEDMFRVDVFWYINNEGNPSAKDGFYAQFWEILRDNNIPFRLHWAKFLPEYDYKEWAAYLRAQHPRWDDFMALRAERDPGNIFLTDYWRQHLFGEG